MRKICVLCVCGSGTVTSSMLAATCTSGTSPESRNWRRPKLWERPSVSSQARRSARASANPKKGIRPVEDSLFVSGIAGSRNEKRVPTFVGSLGVILFYVLVGMKGFEPSTT